LAGKIDAILKLSVVVSVLLASSSVGYYYLVHLPHRDAQFEPERVLERLRAAAKKRAEQEQLLFEQQASERRAAEQQALEERQALEKANRYEACLSRATDNYNASRLAACNRPREKIIKDRDNCIKLGFSEKVCAMAHVVREASPNCTLPRAVALSLDADVEKARDRCLKEDRDVSRVGALLSSTQIRTAGLGAVIVEPSERAPNATPSLKARAPSPEIAAVHAAPIGPGAGLIEPIPMAPVLHKAPASASKPTAMPSAAAAPVVPHAPEAAPEASAIVVDGNSGNLLYSAKSDELRHPASLTKIMTLYLLFERMEAGEFKLNSQLSVSQHASVQAPSKLGLRPGQTITVEDAIRAMVTKSANDVAVVVAEAIGGSEGEFANMMTKKARALGMGHTVYRNASGLPSDEQVTTAREQAMLGRAIQEQFPRQYRYFSTPSFTYHGQEMRNHNNLLGHVEGVDGIKTGYTQASGFNLVTSVHRNNRYIVAVVLGGASAGERDARMRALIETHIALASTNHTATAIAQAVGAKTEKRTAEAKAVAPSGENTPAYAVASLAPQAAWPELKFVPAAPAADVPTTVTAAEMAAAASASEIPPLIPKPAALVDVGDTIKPVQLKTIKAKLTQIQTAGLMSVEPAEPAPIGPPLKARAPSPKSAAASAISPGAALTEPIPVAAVVPKGPASSKPTAMSSAAATAVVPHAPEAATPETKRSFAPQRAPTHAGWIIQIGAFDIERDAQRQLSSAHAKAGHVLDHADPFTEVVMKGDNTLYRARFAGFQQKDEAEAVCKQLKLQDIDCITIRN
jgi:D-alanyl-D-alanine carboxypeptidase